MNANLIFETLNGAWTIALTYVIVFVLIYLYTSFRAQGWAGFWRSLWFDRPLPEQFAIAILISDVGNWIVRGATWVWRRSGVSLGTLEGSLFWGIAIGAFIGTVGILCKLRVISMPRFGHGPWIACAITIAAFVAYEILLD